jgi:hypothetical protein
MNARLAKPIPENLVYSVVASNDFMRFFAAHNVLRSPPGRLSMAPFDYPRLKRVFTQPGPNPDIVSQWAFLNFRRLPFPSSTLPARMRTFP